MGKMYQILLVGNDENNADLIERELNKLDTEVQLDVIKKEEKLVDRLEQKPPDLIISNYNLTTLSGAEALEIVREKYSHLPFIIVSENIGEEQAMDAIREGATEYIMKQNLDRLGPAILREITHYDEHKKQSRQLEETRNKYEILVQSVNGIVWEADAGTFEFNYVSPQSEQILGYTPEEWLREPGFWQEHIHPEDRREALDFCRSQTQQGEDHSFEYRMLDADDEVVWLRDYVTVVTVNGEPDRLRGLLVDISREKKAERQRDKAYEIANIGHWELDMINDHLYWSKAVKKLHEVEPDYEPNLDAGLEFYKAGEHRQIITNAVENAIKTGEPFDEELKIITANNKEKWVRVLGETEFRDGECVRIYGSTQDITQRKEAEQKLRDIIEHSTNMFYRHDTNHVISYISPQSKAFLGYEPEEAKRKWTEFATDHPLNKKGFEHTQRAIDTGKTQPSFPLQLQKKNGEKIWVRVNEAPLTENGETMAIVGSLTDITKQKNLEQLLQQTNRLAKVGSWKLDMAEDNNDEMYWSDMTREILEVDNNYDPTLTGGFEFYEPESKKRIQEAVDKAINKGTPFDEELLITTAKGNKRWIRCIGQTDYYDGSCKRMYGSFQDIHQRKEAEIKMREAFQEREKILDRINEAFFAIDQNWIVTYWNKQAEKVIDVQQKEIIGKNLWEMFPGAKERKFFEEYERALNQQISVHFEEYYPPLEEWLEVNAYPSEEGLSVFFRGITDRKEAEQSLRESLKEKETLLMEIHHRVKNNLAVVSGMMQLQAFNTEDKNLKDKLFDSVVRIKTMASIHEILYQSNSYANLELGQNIKKLVSNVMEYSQLDTNIALNFDLESVVVNINQAIPCSLIVNEVVTNAFKHAFDKGQKGTLSVEISEENKAIHVRIKDNGKGLPDNFENISKNNSLGFKLIDTLATQLKGEFTYEALDQGTLFTLNFEKADVKGIGNTHLR